MTNFEDKKPVSSLRIFLYVFFSNIAFLFVYCGLFIIHHKYSDNYGTMDSTPSTVFGVIGFTPILILLASIVYMFKKLKSIPFLGVFLSILVTMGAILINFFVWILGTGAIGNVG